MVPSCSSVIDNYVIPQVDRSRSTSGPCVRLRFRVGRQVAFYVVALLGPVGLCTLPLLALLVPRPLSRDSDVTGSRFDWRIVRVPALLVLACVFIFQLHFTSRLLRTRLSLIGDRFLLTYLLPYLLNYLLTLFYTCILTCTSRVLYKINVVDTATACQTQYRKNCPPSRIEVRPTALMRYHAHTRCVDIDLWY